MESHLVRIINRLEMMAADGGNLKRNFEREGVVVAEVSFSNDPENGPVFTLRDVEARESYSFDRVSGIFIRMKAWGDACMACQNSQCFNSLAKLLAWCRLGNT